MSIEHIALWTSDLERLRRFYTQWFGAQAGEKYVSARAPFESYFLRFESGARLELMQRPELQGKTGDPLHPALGWAHVAISVGTRQAVDRLAASMTAAGITVVSEPRQTGDGYYEAVVLDPDGNLIEITV